MMDNLTACAIAARKLGMSYGQYMATRKGKPLIAIPMEQLIPEDRRKVCGWCGKVFYAKNRLKNYCDDECRIKAYRRNARIAYERKHGISADDVRICRFCGQTFNLGERSRQSKYCSRNCCEKMSRQRKRVTKNEQTEV